MKYKLTEPGSDFSANDISRSSSFQPAPQRYSEEDRADALSGPTSSCSSPILQPEVLRDSAGRVVSGQSDIRNEELSPIYVARHNTDDGKVDYAALDLSANELKQRLEDLQSESQQCSTTDDPIETSQILPGDMTEQTDDYAHNGRFVNLRRGGQSQEGSFQRRMLSPSSLPAIDETIMLPEESMQASTPKQLPNIKKTRASNDYMEPQSPPPVPRAPHPSPTKSDQKIHKSNSGSPLKLFGTYDTFTNQKLLRRLSQFEEHFDGNEEGATQSTSGYEVTRPELNEAFVDPSSPDKMTQENHVDQHTSWKVNSFGEGDLDSFRFSEEISYDSNRSNSQNDDKENISLPVLDPTRQTKFKFQLKPSPALEEGNFTQRLTKITNTTSTTKHTISVQKTIRPDTATSDDDDSVSPSSQQLEDLATPRKRNGDSDGKRLPKSPLKYPTPKRRRTLQKTDVDSDMVAEEDVDLDSLRDTHHQMQSVLGKKRKDARHDDDQQAANPKVLAMRQILRPRTPTPSQRSSQQQGRAPLEELTLTSSERAQMLQEEKIAMIQAELDTTDPPKGLMAHRISQQMHDDSRKGSVTTQDFLDEAKKIMAGIRGKARPRSGLTSVEESETEADRNVSAGTVSQNEELEESYQESTKEPFSRPPSREGGPIQRLPPMQQDPVLLDHLRKYEEMSDMDEIIASSMKSIALAKDAANSAKEIDRIAEETISRASGRVLQPDNIESDPPNIRISENAELQRKRKHSTSSVGANGDEQGEAEFPSQGSSASSQSTSRSIPTGSSRGSDSRRVIAPHTVSHLIPEQLAGMVFDRERNIWIKRKTVSGESGAQNYLQSDETEEYPFGDIPDLSVDETQELQRIKAVAARRKEEEREALGHYAEHHQDTLKKEIQSSRGGLPPSIEEDLKVVIGPSSEPSKSSVLESSGSNPENTKSMSRKDGQAQATKGFQLPQVKTRSHSIQKSKSKEVREELIEEVEGEISIHEDRVTSTSPKRRRNVTISFSSPIASVIQPSQHDEENSLEDVVDESSESDNGGNDDSSVGSVTVTKRGSNRKISSTKRHYSYRNSSRRLSRGGHAFSGRPVSRIDEQDEESFIEADDDRHKRSVSIVMTTPVLPRRISSMVVATPRLSHEVGTLELSPLSDFTMHQEDESFGLEVSYVDRGQRYVPGNDAKRTLSLSIKDLVEKLTEVEPYEPFWEHIKQMDLRDRKLTNLHKLDEFCGQIEELDVSKNEISQLNGAPPSIRHLRITHNCLSDLSAWNHLSNLQYIDVSNNELESLSGLKSLVHLRGLRADNNRITTLDGIGNLDGLLTLRLRGNLVESLDFKGTKLQRLSDLDLNDNRIHDIKNLHELQSLSNLNLEGNRLDKFSVDKSEQPSSLKYLKLSGNNLTSIDVSQCPNLRLLYLDRNRLGTVTGLLKTKHLDSLSMREQQDVASIDLAFLSEAFEVRKLFLSGNLLKTFEPRIDFLNLQYLELANCGLQSLPLTFGQMLSNIRVLNLNFNALKDIKPLLGIVRLKKLHLAGNRLSILTATTNILADFPTLTWVDMRHNPLTVGFYPPMTIKSLVVGENGSDDITPGDPFTLGMADSGSDDKYASCLDMETKKLRRVYEMLVLVGCARLKILDGLSVKRSILAAKDTVYEALFEAGVIRGPLPKIVITPAEDEVPADEPAEPKAQEEPIVEERWHAEDSFA